MDGWPAPPGDWSPGGDARLTLMAAPGRVHRLGWRFDSADRAAQAAAEFAAADPGAVLPPAADRFEAQAVFDEADGAWRIVTRYLPGEPSLYPDGQTWMIEWLTPTIRRPLRSGVMWCPQWWRHPEVVVRLDALWRAWEAARVEGGAGMAMWWDMHFDAHWAAITSDCGPFAACKDRVHSDKLTHLPFELAPENWPWASDDPSVRR